jgi:TonB family protein
MQAKPQVASPPAAIPQVTTSAAPTTAREPAPTVDTPSGQIVHQVLPEVPDYARRTIRGVVKIQVRATVDASGHVTDATVVSQNSRYFAKLAGEAAQRWDFAGGPGDWLLRFDFTTAGTTVHSSPVRK